MKMAMMNPSGVVNYTKDITNPMSPIPKRRNIGSRSINGPPNQLRATTGFINKRMNNYLQKNATH